MTACAVDNDRIGSDNDAPHFDAEAVKRKILATSTLPHVAAALWRNSSDYEMNYHRLAYAARGFGVGGDCELSQRELEGFLAQGKEIAKAARTYFEPPTELDIVRMAETEPQPAGMILAPWLPEDEVTLLGGHGGTGKSVLALHLSICLAAGVPFFGIPVHRRKVAFFSWEDGFKALHRRSRSICRVLHLDLRELQGQLRFFDCTRWTAELTVETRDGRVETTPVYDWMMEKLHEVGAEVFFLDGVSDCFGGNENVRSQVRTFIRQHIRPLIPKRGAAFLISHIDKAAARSHGGSAEGYSGNTAWNNSVRARWYLRSVDDTKKDGPLILELQKSNYGPKGNQIEVRFNAQSGTFDGRPLEASEIAATTAAEDEALGKKIVRLIREADERGKPVPDSQSGSRNSFAVLSVMKGFPPELRSDRRRFYSILERLRQDDYVLPEEIRMRNRHRGFVLKAAPDGF